MLSNQAEEETPDYQCGYCHTELVDGNHNAAPRNALMGYNTVKIDYDIQCFSCWKTSTIRVTVKSPFHIVDGEPRNV